MTIQELREKIAAAGVDVNDLDNNTLVDVAKILGFQSTRPPKAELVEHTTSNGHHGMYIKAAGVPFTKSDGKKTTSMPLFIPLDTLEQTIEDLKFGLELAKEKGFV